MFKKKMLYKECLETKKQCGELDIARGFEVKTDQIVVKKVSFVSRVLEMIMDLIYRLGKIIFWVAICIVLSIGVTAIVNPDIRGMIFNNLPL